MVAAVALTLGLLVAWRAVSDPLAGAPHARADSPAAQSAHSLSGSAIDVGVTAARLDTWLDTLPRQAMRPTTYGLASSQAFRVVHSRGFTGAEDYAAVAQLRDAAGHWAVIAQGDVAAHPPLDASGRFLAFTVGRVNPGEHSIRTWVYVVRRADARVVAELGVDRARHVVGWLGDKVILDSYDDGGTIQLLDWRRPTPVLDDLGPGSNARRDTVGDTHAAAYAGEVRDCLMVWRFTSAPPTNGDCPGDQVLAVSPNGRWAISQDLHWVRLTDGEWLTIGSRPDGVLGRSATFLADGRVLIDVTHDATAGARVAATVLCSRTFGCSRVPGRTPGANSR